MERLWQMSWKLGLCSALEGLGFLKVRGRLCHWGLYGASSFFRALENFTLN